MDNTTTNNTTNVPLAKRQKIKNAHDINIVPDPAAMKILEHENISKGFVTDFHTNGCAIVRNFASASECDGMRKEMAQLIENWDPKSVTTFRTDEKQELAQGSSDYFLDSANRIHFFCEPGVVDENTGEIIQGMTKDEGLNKVGHGLHVANPIFMKYAQSAKVAALARALGWKNPVLPQSMYIFKQPKIGGEVTSHQDSTFLFTEPRQTCLGLWLALEDATEENGCVWGRPGSHKEPVRRHFKRNKEWFEMNKRDVPQMIFENLVDNIEKSNCPWEGGMPGKMKDDSDSDGSGSNKKTNEKSTMDKYKLQEKQKEDVRQAGFIPLSCKKGDLVLIHGSVDHLSLANISSKSRHTFQLHLIDGPKEGIKWSEGNWLQYPKGIIFPALDL